MQINDLCLSAAKLEHPPSEAKNNVYLINKSTGSVLLYVSVQDHASSQV